MKIRVLCNVIQHGPIYGKKGSVLDVPDEVGAALCKGTKPHAEQVINGAAVPTTKKR